MSNCRITLICSTQFDCGTIQTQLVIVGAHSLLLHTRTHAHTQDLLKKTDDDHADKGDLQKALELILKAAQRVDDAITNRENFDAMIALEAKFVVVVVVCFVLYVVCTSSCQVERTSRARTDFNTRRALKLCVWLLVVVEVDKKIEQAPTRSQCSPCFRALICSLNLLARALIEIHAVCVVTWCVCVCVPVYQQRCEFVSACWSSSKSSERER